MATNENQKTDKPEGPGFLSRVFLPVSTVFGTRYIKDCASIATRAVGQIFKPAISDRTETFEEAMVRLDLTEAQLEKQKKSFFRQSLFFFLGSVGLILFSFYRLYILQLVPGALGLFLSGVVLAYAFRAHFWYFQIKHRKLGCTFAEWWSGSVKKEETD